MRIFSSMLLLASASALADDAAPAPVKARPNSIAVMDTTAQGVPDAYAALMNQTITTYIANNLGMEVISKDDIKKLVNFEVQKQLLGCDSGACAGAANVGESLGVEKIATSTLGKIGDRYQMTVVVIDPMTAKVVGRAQREVRSDSEIVENCRDLVHLAVKKEERESKGYLRVEVSEAAAKIILDGTERGFAPLPAPLRLLQGQYKLHIEKDGFLPWDGTVTVEAGKEAAITAKLIAKGDITVAGAGFLPWAGATAGLAAASLGVSVYSFLRAQSSLQAFNDKADKPYDPATKTGGFTQDDLKKVKEELQLWGAIVDTCNVDTFETNGECPEASRQTDYGIAYYTGVGSAVLGVASVALFSAYFLSGVGSGGDAPPADAPFAIEPTPNGLVIRF